VAGEITTGGYKFHYAVRTEQPCAYNSQVGLRRLVANPRRRVLLLLVRAKRLTAVAGTN